MRGSALPDVLSRRAKNNIRSDEHSFGIILPYTLVLKCASILWSRSGTHRRSLITRPHQLSIRSQLFARFLTVLPAKHVARKQRLYFSIRSLYNAVAALLDKADPQPRVYNTG